MHLTQARVAVLDDCSAQLAAGPVAPDASHRSALASDSSQSQVSLSWRKAALSVDHSQLVAPTDGFLIHQLCSLAHAYATCWLFQEHELYFRLPV